MIVQKIQTKFEVCDSDNVADIIIDHRNETYEIYKRSVKTKKFLKIVKDLAEVLNLKT